MSTPVTRGQLKTRALQRADMQNSLYIDTSAGGELEQLVDTECRKLWNTLADKEPSYGQRGPFYLSSVGGQAIYFLPADFMRLARIYYVPATGTGRKIELRRFNEAEYGQYSNYFNWGPPPIRYDLTGEHQIIFDPAPSISQTNIIEYWYVPAWNPPANDTVPLTGFVVPGWEDYVVDGVAANLRIKEESDPSLLLQRQLSFEARLMEQAANRDRLNPQRIQDVGWNESDAGAAWGPGYAGIYGTW